MKRLWSNSLVFKFFLTYLAITLLLFAGFYLYSGSLIREFYVSSLGSRMEREARLLGRNLPFVSEVGSLDAGSRRLAADLGARITIIAADGQVLGDSAEPSETMENQGSRPELIDAFSQGTGSATRYSDTAGYDMLYRAFHQGDGQNSRVIVVAVPLNDIETVISSIQRALGVGLLAASALALLFAYVFSQRLSRRIKRIVDFSREVAKGSFPQNFFRRKRQDEIDLLEQHLNEMSVNIRDNIEQVIAEKEKVDSILRCMVEGVLVLDPKGQVLLINEQAAKMFPAGHDRDLRGASIVDLSRHPEMRRTMQEVIAFDFSRGLYSREIELEEGRWFRVNAVSLRSGKRTGLGSILVFHDITEIKRFESVRSDFVANVSHELRTPLTAIRGYVETLLRTPPSDPADTRHFLGIIERHSERLSRLTEDLLTLSDLESGKAQLTRQPLEVGHLVQRVLEVFFDQAARKNIKLKQVVDPGLPPVLGDLDRLQQLFINLVDNAVKYTPVGGQVRVSASSVPDVPDGESRIEISIADTGPGIPEKDLPRITERFYRVDKARSRDLGGTGLGLAIVKHIVQAHKGDLKIESGPQKGTTIRVSLPAAASEESHKTILFLCTGNSCRSQMAEGFARRQVANGTKIYSAGTDPKEIHPLAIEVMKEVGIDISQQESKDISAVPLDKVNLLITLCGDAAESCPTIPTQVERAHWPLPDPALAQGSAAEVLKIFRDVRDEIRARVEKLFAPEMKTSGESSETESRNLRAAANR
jgi:two-component system phosphate regulon sensor histidine kinase PhoR